MRIITGSLGGRTFDSPNSAVTHPMSEKMRGAIFNMLGDIEGLSVLDSFAGSGALSLEAISRGAASVTGIDVDNKAYKVFSKNAANLDVSDKVTIIKADAGKWSKQNLQQLFDVALLDPPYNDIDPSMIRLLSLHAKPKGVVVISLPADCPVLITGSEFDMLAQKSYGDAQLQIYRRL